MGAADRIPLASGLAQCPLCKSDPRNVVPYRLRETHVSIGCRCGRTQVVTDMARAVLQWDNRVHIAAWARKEGACPVCRAVLVPHLVPGMPWELDCICSAGRGENVEEAWGAWLASAVEAKEQFDGLIDELNDRPPLTFGDGRSVLLPAPEDLTEL